MIFLKAILSLRKDSTYRSLRQMLFTLSEPYLLAVMFIIDHAFWVHKSGWQERIRQMYFYCLIVIKSIKERLKVKTFTAKPFRKVSKKVANI